MRKTLAIVVCLTLLVACSNSNWRTASREPAGIAANPLQNKQAIFDSFVFFS